MKAVWALTVLLVMSSLMSHGSLSTTTETDTTSWADISTELPNEYNSTMTAMKVSSNTTSNPVTSPTPHPPIYGAGAVSISEYKRVSRIQGWLYLALEAVALVLLTLSTVAFLQDRHSPSNIYLASICLAEAWYMVVLFSHNVCKMRQGCFVSLTYVKVSIWTVSYTGMATRRCVYALTALVSLQRFVAVAFPLQARSGRVLHRPWLPLGFLVVFSFLMHLYRPLQYTPVRIRDGLGDKWTQGFSDTFLYSKQVFLAFADAATYLLIYLPLLICFVSNCLLIATLARHNKDISKTIVRTQKQDVSRSKTERQMTVTILGSTFLMLLFNTPININEAVAMHSADYGILKKEHYLYMVIRSWLSIVSQASDILVTLSYLILSALFRSRFLAMFNPLCRALRRLFLRQSSTYVPTSAAQASMRISSMNLASQVSGQ